MYNIPLSADPEFNDNPLSQRPQEVWSFNPASILEIVSFIGVANPTVTVATHIQNYLLTFPGVYEFIYIYHNIVHPIINGAPAPMFTLSGVIADASHPGYSITANNLDVDNILNFQLNNIPPGRYLTTLEMKVRGKVSGISALFGLDTIPYTVNVVRLNSDQMYASPAGFVEMSYLLGGSLPAPKTKTLHVLGAFTAYAGKHISLSGGNLVFQNEIDGVKTYTGSGTQEVSFSLDASIALEPDLAEFYSTDVTFANGTVAYGVGVKVWIYGNEVLTVTPPLLEFTAIKGIREAAHQLFYIQGVGNYTITFPNWLELDGSPTDFGTRTRSIKPVHSDNLSVGIYTGKIKIATVADDYFIDVKHSVLDNIKTGFSKTAINFTRDRAGISTIYGLDTQKVNLIMSISTFANRSLINTIRPASFSKGLFNQEADFWLGNVVQKVMPPLKKLADIGLNYLSFRTGASVLGYRVWKYYNPALVLMYVEYINRATGEHAGTTETFSEIRFLKGRKPSRFSLEAGILDFFTSPIRVTRNSFAILPVFRNDPDARIVVKKNGEIIDTLYPDRGQNQVFGLQVSFKNFTPGDVIDIALATRVILPTAGLSQRYIMLEEGKQSYHIAWETEHGVLQLLEFTGDYQFLSEHKGITNLSFDRYLEYTQKMGTERILKFSANTGWIFKANQERIDSLLDANRAWIVFSNNRPSIELIPADAKITNIDSDAKTYQYTVDFTINPRHELENNSF